MWRMEKWLDLAKGTLRGTRSGLVPSGMEQLEDAIQDHREFLMELDGHKSLMMSINVISSHLSEHSRDGPKVEALQARLADINEVWDSTCEDAAVWQTKLQTALLENAEFHRTIEELTRWLDDTTNSIRSSEPVDLSVDREILISKRDKFAQLHADLERCEPRIVSLQEAADQLELQTHENRKCRLVKQKLSLLSQKLRILINVCHVYASRLERVLGGGSTTRKALLPRTAEENDDEDQEILPTLSNEVSLKARFAIRKDTTIKRTQRFELHGHVDISLSLF